MVCRGCLLLDARHTVLMLICSCDAWRPIFDARREGHGDRIVPCSVHPIRVAIQIFHPALHPLSHQQFPHVKTPHHCIHREMKTGFGELRELICAHTTLEKGKWLIDIDMISTPTLMFVFTRSPWTPIEYRPLIQHKRNWISIHRSYSPALWMLLGIPPTQHKRNWISNIPVDPRAKPSGGRVSRSRHQRQSLERDILCLGGTPRT